MTNIKYKIIEVVLSDNGELIVGFECFSSDVDPIKKTVSFSCDTTEDEVLDVINDIAYNTVENARTKKKNKQDNAERKNERKERAKPLKDSISDKIGEETHAKKPKKVK